MCFIKLIWWTVTLQVFLRTYNWFQVRNQLSFYRRVLRKTGLFDNDWYLARYPDVVQAGLNPLVHYFKYGASEGRDPSPHFDSDWYLLYYPDVSEAGLNPLSHYIKFGADEGRAPCPWLNIDHLSQCPDMPHTRLNPSESTLRSVQAEGCQHQSVTISGCCGGIFDEQFYRANYLSDLNDSDEATHYLQRGVLGGASPNKRIANKRIRCLSSKPMISILMPVYNSPRRLLMQAIDSVLHQTYENWELCIQDDGSTLQETLEVLEELHNARVHVTLSSANQGISEATNSALGCAQGEFVAMMDHDDLLAPDCLAEIMVAHNHRPDADVFYTDQACVDDCGIFTYHHYKPDWSPWMFRGVMYVGHLLVVRRTIAEAAKGFDPAFDFVQDFEFMLRVSELTDRIVHVPRVLYYWRQTSESVAGGGKVEIDFGQLQATAVNAHLVRLQLPVRASKHPIQPHRAILEPHSDQVTSIRVLVMPDFSSENNLSDMPVQKLTGLTSYDNVQWTQLSPSDMQDASRLLTLLGECDCEIWIFINSLCEPVQNDWLTRLSGYVTLPGVGSAGPVLIGKDGKVASAGMIMTRNGAVSAMNGFDPNSDGYAGSLSCIREVSALSPDCIVLRKDVLQWEGGLRPEYGLGYNLLDVGVRCQRAGLSSLLVPNIQIHWIAEPESCLDGYEVGRRYWRNRRGPDMEVGDIYYNPHLNPLTGNYTTGNSPAKAAVHN